MKRYEKSLKKIENALTRKEEGMTVMYCSPEFKEIKKRLKLLDVIIDKEPYMYLIKIVANYEQYKENVEEWEDKLTPEEFWGLKELYLARAETVDFNFDTTD